jgi:PAS domain S-box-containing protein
MTKSDLRILMLEDEPLDAELNRAQLQLLDEYNCIVQVVGDKASYIRALETTNPDIILSDYNLPQYNGLEALNDLISRNLLIPFIFVTGTLNEEIAAGTIKAGAWDYIVKDRLFRLPLAIRSVLKLKEQRLASSLVEDKISRLLAAIDQTTAQIIVTNPSGIIEYANKKFTEISGHKAEEVIGLPTSALTPDPVDYHSFTDAEGRLSRGEVIRGEVRRINSDGTECWELISITPIRNSTGEITNYVTVKEDITQQKMLEQQLIEARDKAELSDKLKDAFLQNLSHEIRTPLNAIVGFSELLHIDTEKISESMKKYTSIICSSSKQLLSIVSDVLTMASIQTGQEIAFFAPVDINKMMGHLYEIFLPAAGNKNLTFLVSKVTDNGPFFINTDEIKLNQILVNLLNNAIKFTHQGSVEMIGRTKGNTIEILVRDTGIGIPKESQDIIFERFRQAKRSIHYDYGGTGLGLSISRSFAHMIGGEITVESEPDKGSTFCLNLPWIRPEDRSLKEKTERVTLTDKNITILVAEDEINNFLLLKAILKKASVTLIHSINGEEAVRVCLNNPSVDLVIMDIKMPVMDGIQAFREIRKIRKDLPVIAQTAYALEREKQEFLNMGFDAYIAKPIIKDHLVSIINSFFK